MPKRIDLSSNKFDGISVTWTPTKQRLDFSGWYDGCVGIGAESLTLKELFDRLGITEKDCRKAFKSPTP